MTAFVICVGSSLLSITTDVTLVQVKSNLCIHESNFFQPDINLLYLLLFFTDIGRKLRHKQGNSFPYVHSKFSFGAKCAKIFKIS